MEISLADERALLLKEQLTLEQAEGRAWSKKLDAFGRMAKMGSFIQRPKDDDFEFIYKEHRVEPFWHMTCTIDLFTHFNTVGNHEKKKQYLNMMVLQVNYKQMEKRSSNIWES